MANWGLFIGINQYKRLKPLKCAKQDAVEMARYCRDEINFEEVFLFTDESDPITAPNGSQQETKPTYTNLMAFLQDFFESQRLETGDNFWFFFSGHGLRHQGQDYLVPSEGHPTLIEQTTIPLNYVTQRLRRCGADNIILFLDACRNENDFSNKSVGWQKQQGVITIASCSPTEESYEIPELQQGSFTYSLLEALRIQGENNCATVERLCNRLRERIPEINRQHNNPPQTLHSIVEPHYKNHLILLPKQAKTPDIELLRVEALELEVEGKLEEARQLMRRVLALDTTRPKYWQDYDRINRKLAQQPVPPSPKTEPINGESAKTITEPPKPAAPPEIELKSEKGIDYRKLRDLLEQQQWKEADEETRVVMLQGANRRSEGWLRVEDMDNFPCEDLRTIDQLWVKYSGGRFGFSVQAKIYRELGGTRQYNRRVWDAFGDRVGWRVNNSWIFYNDVTFDLKAPLGHLPGQRILLGGPWRVGEACRSIFSRVETCKTITETPKPAALEEIELKSAKGIDYRNLEDLLKRQQWKEADEETRVVMLQGANRRSEGWLREEDIDNFPCEDLRTINQLWVKYSGGKFGFSVQAKIYRELGGTREYNQRVWNAFGDRVGWRVNNSWIYYRDVTFDLKAPQGHLPVRLWDTSRYVVNFGGGGSFSSLASRLVKCNI
ncbi:GUN4 domain-containing protein [Microcystis viridis]|uniref:GUN4 domain-containing protein n=1 Tax=Microcystis viridis FACHB-1342 TaxID=2692900 RepID=A0ABR8GG65_MICVR|nr:GUN4 domain-containing protein [Microcystis viridis]MBD2602075.1 GUN4 domain-containing protein [Microcystis viridis FACHB-1342]